MSAGAVLAPAPPLSWSLPHRLVRLFAGLALFAVSIALLVQAGLGATPWDVLHQGLARQTGLSFGTVTFLVGLLVLAAWVPLRERPGFGTVANVVVVSAGLDACLAVLPAAPSWPAAAAMCAGGVLLNGLATALYVGARLGPGPRDGLMTGLVRRTGGSVRLVRGGIEVALVVTGFVLGGTVGVGTLLYALAIGPLVHVLLPRLSAPEAPAAT
ncbi:YitT family protein [Quadrisphaera sp. DSM 44207]|uniref:membrane protein YczE n=1 Tax=Quadrisphaera sp. DSM 44207 TaxID=1881057 RepID=UPI00087F8609|nr:hypothetical protein [Quadrisphaera sp. DSM 44207]SDQ69225.1 Uncharacterized membrane protein YczE [Quadrisphaera sp. DSM 44207]